MKTTTTTRRTPAYAFVLRRDVRQRILAQLAESPATAREIADALHVPVSTIRANLRALEPFDLVVSRRRDRPSVFGIGKSVTVRVEGKSTVISVKTPDGKIEISRPSLWFGTRSFSH